MCWRRRGRRDGGFAQRGMTHLRGPGSGGAPCGHGVEWRVFVRGELLGARVVEAAKTPDGQTKSRAEAKEKTDKTKTDEIVTSALSSRSKRCKFYPPVSAFFPKTSGSSSADAPSFTLPIRISAVGIFWCNGHFSSDCLPVAAFAPALGCFTRPFENKSPPLSLRRLLSSETTTATNSESEPQDEVRETGPKLFPGCCEALIGWGTAVISPAPIENRFASPPPTGNRGEPVSVAASAKFPGGRCDETCPKLFPCCDPLCNTLPELPL
mmetsp:Transcript_9250/g.34502  ORF Transcript_9250/g.34502 Transcript_9250/m.34502 type:complete len:267 (-) Transcript_9250:2552-3352(-)